MSPFLKKVYSVPLERFCGIFTMLKKKPGFNLITITFTENSNHGRGKFKNFLTRPSIVLPLHLKQTFLPIIWIFTEGEGDGIESRLTFEIFSTLCITENKKIKRKKKYKYLCNSYSAFIPSPWCCGIERIRFVRTTECSNLADFGIQL